MEILDTSRSLAFHTIRVTKKQRQEKAMQMTAIPIDFCKKM